MALNFLDELDLPLQGARRRPEPDILQKPRRAATVIVAADGSGDYDSIQEGINELPPEGGVVSIKEGNFPISSSLTIEKNNVTLIGTGNATKILSLGNFQLLGVVGYSGIHIEKIYFYGSGAGNDLNSGILFAASSNSVITGCQIENCRFGIDGSISTNGLLINNCQILSNIRSGIFLSGSSSLISITNNVIQNNIEDGIRADDGNNSIISSNIITDNDVNNTATYDGIRMLADNTIIMGNRCKDNDRYEINIRGGSNNVLIGNNCIGTDHVKAINDAGTNTIAIANPIDTSENLYHKGRFVRMP